MDCLGYYKGLLIVLLASTLASPSFVLSQEPLQLLYFTYGLRTWTKCKRNPLVSAVDGPPHVAICASLGKGILLQVTSSYPSAQNAPGALFSLP